MKSSYFRGDKFAGALFFVIMLSTIGTSWFGCWIA
jgi:hypothetical protein